MAELVGNKAIEDAAVEWVMELEHAVERQPQDTRYKGAAADIESPPRVIEVKAFGTSNRGYDLWLETRRVDEAHKNPTRTRTSTWSRTSGKAIQRSLPCGC